MDTKVHNIQHIWRVDSLLISISCLTQTNITISQATSSDHDI